MLLNNRLFAALVLTGLIFCASFNRLAAQGLNLSLLRLDRVLSPGLDLSSEYRFARQGTAAQMQGGVDVVIPLKGKIGLRTDAKEILDIDELRDLTRIIKPDIRQRFLDVGVRYAHRPEPAGLTEWDALDGYVGLSGLRYLDKRYFLLWGLRGHYAEEMETLGNPGVRLSAAGGVARFSKHGMLYYYGLYANYSDGRFIPLPWGGLQARIPGGSRIRMLLPRELSWRQRFGKDKLFDQANWEIALKSDLRYQRTGFAFDSLQSPWTGRGNLESWEIRSGASLAWRIPDSRSWLQVYGGYTPVRRLVADPDAADRSPIRASDYPALRRAFIEVRFTTSLGKDWFNLDLGKLLMP